MIPNPHDRLFRLVFENPKHIAGELRAVLPRALAELLDFQSLKLESGSYIEPEGVGLRSDLLFSLRTRGDQVMLLYVLIEHQSSGLWFMPLRMLEYDVAIWRHWRRTNPKGPLPPILPLVVSHAEHGWTGPTRFQALFGPNLPAGFQPHLPQFELIIDDLKALQDVDLLRRPMPVIARLVLLVLAHARDDRALLEHLTPWRAEWQRAWAQTENREVFMELFGYIMQVSQNVTPAELRDFATQTIGPQTKEVVMTAGQRLVEQGIEQGVDKGRLQILIELLTSRFGLPAEAFSWMATAQSQARDEWATKALLTGELGEMPPKEGEDPS